MELARVIALVLLMAVLWCNVYDMTNLASWSIPRLYGGDAWWNLATIKAYRDGEITPFSFQTVKSLNAPFAANWNDYPSSEKMLPYCVGIVARFIGLMPAFNLAALIAVILAALAFYITCRILNYHWMFGFVGAVMFGFSHYISARQLGHLSLTYYWHIPLYLLVTWWYFDSRDIPIRSSRWWFAVAVGALTGLQAIYYAFLFWQFLGFAMVTQGLRRNWAKLISVISVAAISVGCTVLMAAPLVLYRILHGSNAFVVQRSLSNLQVFALQLPELFLPPFHRWKAFFDFGQTRYFRLSLIRGEMGSPYLGVVGIAGFVWLMGYGVVRLLRGRAHRIPIMFWQSLWIIVFSLVGGLNLLLGVFGLQLFRATNRFSVVLLCLALLFLVKQLGRICPREHQLLLAFFLLLVGLWDILPSFMEDDGIRPTQRTVTSDREFTKHLEQNVPAGTMVFQIPVMDFPEVPPHLGVGDYTHFRPYLYSRTLHFSYGSDKGRARESWQRDVENLSAPDMAEQLERYGFGVILIDRKGYPDAAASLLRDLESSGRKVIDDDETGEFVAVGLRPREQAVLPEIGPFPGSAFYGWEGDWRKGAHSWSEGSATLVLTNTAGKPVERKYTFALSSLSKRRVTVITPKETKGVEVNPGKAVTVGPFAVQLPPGETKIRFETDTPAVPAGGDDPRLLAFSVALLPESAQEPVPVLGPAFYGWEGDWRKGVHTWSRGPATLVLVNSTSKIVEKQYSFSLNSTSKRHVTVIMPAETKTVELNPGSPVTVGPFALKLEPGQTRIRFETDKPAVPAGAGDTRTITFSLAIIPNTEEPPK
jgi:hypothetical protein